MDVGREVLPAGTGYNAQMNATKEGWCQKLLPILLAFASHGSHFG
jgi:hypothetical protein